MIRHIMIVLLLLIPCLAIETNVTRTYVDEVARAEIDNIKLWMSQYTPNLESMDALMNDFGGVIRDTIITRALILVMIIFGASGTGLVVFYVVRQFYVRFDNRLSILEDKICYQIANSSKVKEDTKKESGEVKEDDSKDKPNNTVDSNKTDVAVNKKDTKKEGFFTRLYNGWFTKKKRGDKQ